MIKEAGNKNLKMTSFSEQTKSHHCLPKAEMLPGSVKHSTEQNKTRHRPETAMSSRVQPALIVHETLQEVCVQQLRSENQLPTCVDVFTRCVKVQPVNKEVKRQDQARSEQEHAKETYVEIPLGSEPGSQSTREDQQTYDDVPLAIRESLIMVSNSLEIHQNGPSRQFLTSRQLIGTGLNRFEFISAARTTPDRKQRRLTNT